MREDPLIDKDSRRHNEGNRRNETVQMVPVMRRYGMQGGWGQRKERGDLLRSVKGCQEPDNLDSQAQDKWTEVSYSIADQLLLIGAPFLCVEYSSCVESRATTG